LAEASDAFLEHALTFALHRLANTAALLSALDHPNPKVQRAALLLLDQAPFQAIPAPGVVSRLDAGDPSLRDTARWVLLRHREWGEAGAAFLHQLLQQPSLTDPDRQALAQFLPLFATNATVMTAVAQNLSSPGVSEGQRAHLLEAMAVVDLPETPESVAEAVRVLLMAPDALVASAAVRTVAALRISAVQPALAAVALDPAQNIGLRLDALRELVRRRPELDPAQMGFLLTVISNATPTTRLAAAEILTSAKLTGAQLKSLLTAVRGDPVISPASILTGLQRHGIEADCVVAVLDYLAAGLDSGWTIPGEDLAKLQAAVPESQRAAADGLLARLSQTVARQRQQLTEFAPLLTGGDYVRGEKIFFEKGQCVTCHRIWENGGRVGPDLSRLGAIRSGNDILESLLVPSATMAQGYETFNVTTKDDDTFTGVRVGTSDDPLRLRFPSGTDVVIHQHEIKRIDRSKLSLMPEGLLNTLSKEEVRDLLAFLQHLK
jgi:putative heme-binding domain-containing protein